MVLRFSDWILERDDQIAHRRKKPGRPIDFGDEQKARDRGRNVVDAASTSSSVARERDVLRQDDDSYRAAIALAAT